MEHEIRKCVKCGGGFGQSYDDNCQHQYAKEVPDDEELALLQRHVTATERIAAALESLAPKFATTMQNATDLMGWLHRMGDEHLPAVLEMVKAAAPSGMFQQGVAAGSGFVSGMAGIPLAGTPVRGGKSTMPGACGLCQHPHAYHEKCKDGCCYLCAVEGCDCQHTSSKAAAETPLCHCGHVGGAHVNDEGKTHAGECHFDVVTLIEGTAEGLVSKCSCTHYAMPAPTKHLRMVVASMGSDGRLRQAQAAFDGRPDTEVSPGPCDLCSCGHKRTMHPSLQIPGERSECLDCECLDFQHPTLRADPVCAPCGHPGSLHDSRGTCLAAPSCICRDFAPAAKTFCQCGHEVGLHPPRLENINDLDSHISSACIVAGCGCPGIS